MFGKLCSWRKIFIGVSTFFFFPSNFFSCHESRGSTLSPEALNFLIQGKNTSIEVASVPLLNSKFHIFFFSCRTKFKHPKQLFVYWHGPNFTVVKVGPTKNYL